MVKKEELENCPSLDDPKKMTKVPVKSYEWDGQSEPQYFVWGRNKDKVRDYIKENIKNSEYEATHHMENLINYMLYKPKPVEHRGNWIKYSDDLSVNVKSKMISWDDENMFIVTNPNDESENTTTIKYDQIYKFEALHKALANNENYKKQFDEYFPDNPTSGGGKKIRNKVRTRSNRMKRKDKITRKNKITRKSKTKKNH